MIFINPESPVNHDIPNLALAYAATHFDVKVVDQNTMPVPRDRFMDIETDILGISVRSMTYSEAQRIAAEYKKKYPDAQIKSISGFLDVQCCYPFLQLNDRIEYKEPFSDKYPFPDFELFDSFPVFKENWQRGKWRYSIMTSLGCPYQCVYCVSRNRKWLHRSAENCVEELRQAKARWGIKSFQIIDDCFNINKERLLKFCELVAPLRMNWVCTNGVRADRFDEDIAKAMSSSGCLNISMGVESTDPEVLKAIKKGETIEQIEKAVKTARRYFNFVNCYFVIGLPGSTYEKDLNSIRWVVKNRINGHFSYYAPFDQTMQYDEVFYGEEAKPRSDVYPKELQERIYKMTASMRADPDIGLTRLIKGRVALALRFDPLHFPAYIAGEAARVFKKKLAKLR